MKEWFSCSGCLLIQEFDFDVDAEYPGRHWVHMQGFAAPVRCGYWSPEYEQVQVVLV